MKLIAYSILLLVILEESYCTSTSTVNKTSTSWGYDYSLNDTNEYKMKHNDKGYQFEPSYSNRQQLKKHYNSRSIYDQFTSPGATDDSQLHTSTNDIINGTTNSRSDGTVPNKVLFETSIGGETTTESRRVPITETHTVTVTETQTEAPVASDKTSYGTPSSSHSIPDGDIIRYPNIPSNGQLYETTFRPPYGSQNTPMYAAPIAALYYPQAPPHGQMYGSAGDSMYGISNGQMYRPPMGPMYGPPMGGTYAPTGPIYGLSPHSMYGYAPPQNGQMYGYAPPQNGQMYGPPNSQINGYPTGSLYESNRNY